MFMIVGGAGARQVSALDDPLVERICAIWPIRARTGYSHG